VGLDYVTETLDLVTSIEPVTNPGVWYAECEGHVKGSSTAMMILSYLTSHSSKIGLLFTKSCDSKYHCAHEYAGAGEKLEKYTGGIAVVNVDNPLTLQKVELPLGVSMLHELGHAKQYLERPSWFYMLALVAGGHYDETGEYEAEHPTERAAIAIVLTPKPTGFNKNPKPIFKGSSATKKGKEEIENDNLARHETPICKELKQPFRVKY